MTHAQRRSDRHGLAGFTLVELLVSISIITLLASMILVALAGVQENAKADRTRAVIVRIDALINERWETFRGRRLPLLYASIPPQRIPEFRLHLLRELMRKELPDRKSDVLSELSVIDDQRWSRNSLQRSYRKKAAKLAGVRPQELNQKWTPTYQGAECLYLILSQMTSDEKGALTFFNDREIGDYDRDGLPEILDGWGQPIEFLRWAPGFGLRFESPDDTARFHDPGYVLVPTIQEVSIRDPFDLRNVHSRLYGAGTGRQTFALYHLIYSAGSDLQYEIFPDETGNAASASVIYAETAPPNNPFLGWLPVEPSVKLIGSFQDTNQDGRDGSLDNITNHALVVN